MKYVYYDIRNEMHEEDVEINEMEQLMNSCAAVVSWKVFGASGHRIKESFCTSYVYNFSEANYGRVIRVDCKDITGTNDYVIVTIGRNTEEECYEEFDGQLSDGIFENQRTGIVERIK